MGQGGAEHDGVEWAKEKGGKAEVRVGRGTEGRDRSGAEVWEGGVAGQDRAGKGGEGRDGKGSGR